MAFHTKQKFAEVCGISTSNLSTYIKRGKVILSGLSEGGEKDLIDDTNPININFLNNRHSKVKSKELINSRSPKSEDEFIETSDDKPLSPESFMGLDIQYKIELTKRIKTQRELDEIKIEKLKAILIPAELMHNVMALFSKSIMTAFHNAAENLLIEYSTIHNLTSSETATIRGKIIAIINNAVEENHTEADKGIENIVKIYSETRGKGERK